MGQAQGSKAQSQGDQTGTQRALQVKQTHITNDYQIKKKLGQGNFALVRLCIRKSDKQQFAVKIIHKKRMAKPKQREALDRETEIMKRVKHKYCVSLEDIYETSNHLYLVLEYCKGGELFDMICKYNHFTEHQATKVISQVTNALQYLHNMGVVHRDIKPENILLLESNPDSIVKLTDFGLANRLDGADLKFKTSCGTLYYAAPEVLGPNMYDEKIDYWSMGVVMYVLLVGYLPFYHDNRAKTIDLIHRGKVHFDMKDWNGISPEARDLIRKLLQPDPTRRYGGEDVVNHDWFSNSDLHQEINIHNLGKYQNWRGGFQESVATMVKIHRWKKYALSILGDDDDDDDYAGIGVGALDTANAQQDTDQGEEQEGGRRTSSINEGIQQDDNTYIPGVGFVIE